MIAPNMLPLPATAEKNIYESPENQSAPLRRNKRGVALFERLWPQNSNLTISLANMDEREKALTKANINQWVPHINLKLIFVETPDADIRITSISAPAAGWSRIGKDAKEIPSSEFSMGINFKNDDNKVIRTIQHEFGHALGLDHEHKHPDRTLEFDKEKLYAYAQSVGMSKAETDSQILFKYHQKRLKIKTSDYDKKSIMHYEFASDLLKDGKGIGMNIELSEDDINFIKTLYPRSLPLPAETARYFNASATVSKLWPNHSTVTLSLLNMSDAQKKFTQEHIALMQPYINLKLEFIEGPRGDIRIAPTAKGKKSWSAIGTDAKRVHLSKPTMGIDFDSKKKYPSLFMKNLFAQALGFGKQ